MIRLLKFTALLLGLFTLLITFGSMVARAEKSTERVAVVVTRSEQDEVQQLLQIWPNFHRPYRLTHDPLRGNVFWGTDTSDKLVYVGLEHGEARMVNYYRVNSSGQPLTRLTETTSGFESSPDCQWLMVMLPYAPVWEYWLIHVPTGRQWSIPALMELPESHPTQFRTGFFFSHDNQWLYLTPQTNPYDLIGIRLVDRAITELAAGVFPAYLEIQTQVGDWLIMESSSQQFYRVRTDGSDFGPLLERESVSDALFATYPADGLVLLHRDNQIVAVAVATAQILWEQTEFVLGFPPAGPPGWINIWQEDINVLLNVSTGETRSLPAELQGPSSTRRSLEGNAEWVLYSRTFNGQEWWVYDWATAKSRLLHQDMQYFRYIGTTPEGQWLLAENTAPPYGLYRLHLHDGTFEKIAAGRGFTYMGWMPPYQPAWQPFPLLFIGVLLIIFPLLTPMLKRLLK